MNLLETFEAKKPDRIIETPISKLFFFGDDVYKVYKEKNLYFPQFADRTFRNEFYHDDFVWNHTMSPDIYVKLGSEKVDANAEDFYIHMKKIDDSKTVYNQIKNGSLEEKDFEIIVREMFGRLENLTRIKRADESMSKLLAMSYVDLDLQMLQSERDWLYITPELILKTEADIIVKTLEQFVSTYSFFKNFTGRDLSASIDNHCGNILYDNGKVSFIDCMPPMKIWHIESKLYVISRLATEVEVLLGKKFADAMYATFEKTTGEKVDPGMKVYTQAVAALIQAPYMYSQGDTVTAKKFIDFARGKIEELKKVL